MTAKTQVNRLRERARSMLITNNILSKLYERARKNVSGPVRVQLSRARGWRMPKNTVKVDRSTRWGNPFVVGKHGDAARCVDLFRKMLHGFLCISVDDETVEAQQRFMRENTWAELMTLKGKNLACWCRRGDPCHADVLLEIVNRDVKA